MLLNGGLRRIGADTSTRRDSLRDSTLSYLFTLKGTLSFVRFGDSSPKIPGEADDAVSATL